jgi:hypothetical protein
MSRYKGQGEGSPPRGQKETPWGKGPLALSPNPPLPLTQPRRLHRAALPPAGPLEAFGALIRDEIATWGEVARTAKVRLDG